MPSTVFNYELVANDNQLIGFERHIVQRMPPDRLRLAVEVGFEHDGFAEKSLADYTMQLVNGEVVLLSGHFESGSNPQLGFEITRLSDASIAFGREQFGEPPRVLPSYALAHLPVFLSPAETPQLDFMLLAEGALSVEPACLRLTDDATWVQESGQGQIYVRYGIVDGVLTSLDYGGAVARLVD